MTSKSPSINYKNNYNTGPGNSYAIDFIFGKMRDKKTKEIKYAVKWEGFTLDDTSWEP